MKLLTALVFLLVVAGTQSGIVDSFISQVKSFFTTHEEAPYDVTVWASEYEERRYPPQKWVCTQKEGKPEDTVEEITTSLFWKLFAYIGGHNAEGKEIEMTGPVTVEVTWLESGGKRFTECFYLGYALQDNPPQPAESHTFIQDRPELYVLTRTVGGYVEAEAEWQREARSLASILERHGRTVSFDHQYWVGYDPPMKFWNRRNEVWFVEN